MGTLKKNTREKPKGVMAKPMLRRREGGREERRVEEWKNVGRVGGRKNVRNGEMEGGREGGRETKAGRMGRG